MKKLLGIIALLLITVGVSHAQVEYQPYSYDFYQKLDQDAYSTSTREHTALKPFFIDDTILSAHYDSLMNYNNDGKQHGWGYRKLFQEHLFESKTANSTFY